LLELLRQGAEQLASQPVAEAEFQAAFAELAAGGLRAVRKAEDKELREPWMNFHGICMNIIKYHIYIYTYYILYIYVYVGRKQQPMDLLIPSQEFPRGPLTQNARTLFTSVAWLMQVNIKGS